MLCVQVELRHDRERMTCWVEKRPTVVPGASLTLRPWPTKRWRVLSVSEHTMESTALERQRRWDNDDHTVHTGLRRAGQ